MFFRLLYSSGIRTNEARLLLRENVDLRRGILDIQYSKGHDQHYIVLHDSMLEIMRRYDAAINGHRAGEGIFLPFHKEFPFQQGMGNKKFQPVMAQSQYIPRHRLRIPPPLCCNKPQPMDRLWF